MAPTASETHTPVTTAEQRRETWALLRAISHDPATLQRSHVLMEEHGIKLGPLKALRFLPVDGSVTMRQLAGRLHCDNSYVTALVDALEERGLASRQPHPTDRRVKEVVLTEEGQALALEVQAIDASPPPGFANLADDEVATLLGLLRKLAAADG